MRRMAVSSAQRQTQRTHDTNNTATLPSVAPLPFLSGISKPVPPEGYRETSVGTGQLLAVSSVISYICPSIGCRCQFRPNRCMAVVSNEKSHRFLLEVETGLPSHRGGWAGVGSTGVQFRSTGSPCRELWALWGDWATGLTRAQTLPSRAHSLGAQGEGQDGGTFRRPRPLLQKIKNNNLRGKRQLVSPRLNFLNTKITVTNNKQSPATQ